MKAYVITLEGHAYSEACASRCIETAAKIGGIHVDRYRAVNADEAQRELNSAGLKWTWGEGYQNLKHHNYGGNLNARIGCAMSHYGLWSLCAWGAEPILILEHDAVFQERFVEFEFKTACQINDPTGATPHGDRWAEQIRRKGPGVHPKTVVFEDSRPDGLAGNSAYVIQPHAAARLVHLFETIGVWPNDAMMCRQLIPDLEEHYPFITRVAQVISTTSL